MGYIYILRNDYLKENIYKIGFTNKSTPKRRAADISRCTGIPGNFEEKYVWIVAEANTIEKKIHNELEAKGYPRIRTFNRKKEFFEIELEVAIEMINNYLNKTYPETKFKSGRSLQTIKVNERRRRTI